MTKADRGKYKQNMAMFCIRGVNNPWQEVLHLGERKIMPRHYEVQNANDGVFYYLEQGSIRLSGISEDGQERVVMIMEQGVLFGETVFLHQSCDHTHSIRTLTKCQVVAFPSAILSDVVFCRDYPHLMINLVKSLGIKVGSFFSQIYDSNLFDAKRQICRIIAHIWREQGEGETIIPNLSQTDMAHILGIHRSSVCRVIRDLRREKVIGHCSKTRIDIINAETLLYLGDLICLLP